MLIKLKELYFHQLSWVRLVISPTPSSLELRPNNRSKIEPVYKWFHTFGSNDILILLVQLNNLPISISNISLISCIYNAVIYLDFASSDICVNWTNCNDWWTIDAFEMLVPYDYNRDFMDGGIFIDRQIQDCTNSRKIVKSRKK